jgi:putative acetyltransferase
MNCQGADMTTETTIRTVRKEDEPSVAAIIRSVMPEFGADGPGFALHDPEVDHMFEAYDRPGARYLVLEADGRVVGGGGVAPLDGGAEGVCELRKMYFLPEARGQGWGQRLLAQCLEAARELGYARCYLETCTGMDAALRLYGKMGFHPLCSAMGATGHGGCDRFYVLDLRSTS